MVSYPSYFNYSFVFDSSGKIRGEIRSTNRRQYGLSVCIVIFVLIFRDYFPYQLNSLKQTERGVTYVFICSYKPHRIHCLRNNNHHKLNYGRDMKLETQAELKRDRMRRMRRDASQAEKNTNIILIIITCTYKYLYFVQQRNISDSRVIVYRKYTSFNMLRKKQN